ncbi:MAG: integrase [Flavobacteriales bacterium]|nr:integrase [Flavobacteriales bacterium]
MSFENLLRSFVVYLSAERRYSDKTIAAYTKELERWGAFLLSEFETTSEKATRDHAKRFIVWRAKDGISNRSINRSLSVLRSFYKWCQKSGRSHKEPLAGIRSLKEQKRIVMSIPESDLLQLTNDEFFKKDFEGIRDQFMLLLLYGLGLRRAELISLRTQDFDWDRSVVKVLGKRNKTRQIPIPISLKAYHDRYIKERSILHPQIDEILVTKKGGKLYPSIVYKRVVYYLQGTTSVVDKYPHAIRHSYATHLLNAGVDINVVKELMGHESLSSTQVYTTSTFEELVQAYNRAHPKGS